jgi:hypothetical protein
MWSVDRPGLSREKIHRYGFFIHAGLMICEVVLGFFTPYALEHGEHDLLINLGIAHCAIGYAIPAVMAAAGLENIIKL